MYEYEIQGRYEGDSEWYTETTEATRAEALERLAEYRENGSGVYRIVRVKV